MGEAEHHAEHRGPHEDPDVVAGHQGVDRVVDGLVHEVDEDVLDPLGRGHALSLVGQLREGAGEEVAHDKGERRGEHHADDVERDHGLERGALGGVLLGNCRRDEHEYQQRGDGLQGLHEEAAQGRDDGLVIWIGPGQEDAQAQADDYLKNERDAV